MGVGKRYPRNQAAMLAMASIALALNASPAIAQDQTAATRDLEAPGLDAAPREAAPSRPFAASFRPYAALPVPLDPPPGAVDLSSFTPPRGPQVLQALGTGIASYYGKRFHGRRTANGERFDMNAMTAAHKTLPFGTFVRVTNPRNGKAVTVRINDRGPFIRGRTIDLSRAAAREIGIIRRGHGRVAIDIVKP